MASGTMQIQYSGVNISSLATKAWKELEDVNEKLNGVRSKLRNLPERSRSGNNLSSASAFLRKKQQQFEQKQTALEVLKQKSDTFMSNVETTEKRLSSKIKAEYKNFHNVTGIGKTAIASMLEKIAGFAAEMLPYLIPVYGQIKLLKDTWGVVKKVGEAIKNWYYNLPEGVRLAIKVVGAVVAVAVAVAAVVASFGALSAAFAAGGWIAAIVPACGFLGAAISAFDSGVSLYKACAAAGHYAFGNKSRARELDAKSNAELFGRHKGFYEGAMILGDVCSIIGGAGSLVKDVKKSVPKISETASWGEKFKTYGKATIKEIFKGKAGVDDAKGFKKYTDGNGGIGKGIQKLFTSDIGDLAKSESGRDALKGIKTFHGWATQKPFKEAAAIFKSGNIGEGIFNFAKFVF